MFQRRFPTPFAIDRRSQRCSVGHRVARATLSGAAVALATILAGPAAARAEGRSGQEVYDTVCAGCHAKSVMKAPRFGDPKAWKPLIAEGQRSLVRTAIKGIRQMPPRGGNPDLTDKEVERAVVYMVNAAGGKFKEPQ
jgi:cytochrome c5